MRFALPNRDIDMDMLRPQSKELRTLLEAFAPISNRFQIYTLCDTMDMSHTRGMGFCDSMSYYMGLPNEELLHMDATYINMIKFQSGDSMDYQKILAILRRTSLQYDLTPQNNDWRTEQLFRLDGLER
jgi:hypothetical protein